jgi:serine/threonine protein kinase
LRYFQQKVKLGQGGFGSVWRAIDRKTNLFVAVKEIDKMKAYWQGAKRSEIQMEISILRACDHVKLFPEDCKLSF